MFSSEVPRSRSLGHVLAQDQIRRETKLLLDEKKRRGLDTQRESCLKKNWIISDEFGIRSPVIRKNISD